VVARTDNSPLLSPVGLAALVGLSHALRARPEVLDVVGPVDLPGGPRGLLPHLLFYRNVSQTLLAHPLVGELFVSRDRKLGLVQLILRDEIQLSDAKRLVATLRRTATPGLTIRIGGLAAAELDLEERQRAYVPLELGMVFATTFLVLFAAFRSVLVPLKAIVLNLLAVGAAMGLIVRVFQDGLGGSWVGLAAGLGSVPITLPLLIFCLTFGLSMDYEIFMLSRVRESRLAVVLEREAIAQGLAATGGIVTAAAGIMGVVFGSFLSADMVLVKILGFGLAVAIGLDATLIRAVLAPALLAIAGRWNWWPGDRPPSEALEDSPDPS
jgi:RND superfamily putative drug exporter